MSVVILYPVEQRKQDQVSRPQLFESCVEEWRPCPSGVPHNESSFKVNGTVIGIIDHTDLL